MRRLSRNIYYKERGFTLAELLIVVIILAVLSGIAVPSYMAMRNRARESATENEMKNIATALELYNADNERYPKELEDLSPNYMDPIPEVDLWGKKYEYTPSGETIQAYELRSCGIDGRAGTKDDIVFENGQMTEDGAYANR